jgi:cytoskeletal protein CcmA (bactofilin family)
MGLSMFRRRKPEDEPETKMETPPANPFAKPLEPARPADNGLGVPPRPPATSPSATAFASVAVAAQTATNKDAMMGRPPFATPTASPNTTPATSSTGNPPMPTSTPTRPQGPPAPPSGRTGPERPVAPPERRTLVVGRGISVQGMVQDAERLVVEGTVEATMIHATELSVSLGGVFKGEVEVEMAEVAGLIDGTVTARANLVVRATGVVLGTARCRRLQVEEGGQITGRIEMLTEPARAPAPAPVARAEPVEAKPVLSYES